MKRIIAFLLAIALVSTFTSAHPGRTDSKGGHHVNTPGWGYDVGTYHYHDKKYDNIVPVVESTGKPTQVTVIVNGETVFFDQPPVNTAGRVLVPIRFVTEKIGCSVEWDDKTETVYINSPDVPLRKTAVKNAEINVYVNNEKIKFDQPPVNINGRVFVPVRFVVERLGYTVGWDEELQIVYIESK